RRFTEEAMAVAGSAAEGIAALESGLAAWRAALVAADDVALDTVGHSAYPWGSDPDEPFLTVVAWVNQEVLHHGAEIALLRDLFRATAGRTIGSPGDRPALRAVVVDTTDARALGEFYRELLGYTYRAGDESPAPGAPDPRGADWLVLLDA